MQEPDELPVSSTASFQQPSLLYGLNPEQLAAVTLPAQPALILAGAGSGKTRVLTTRLAWLVTTRQVSPAGVLAVTFTNKAAKEMLARLSAMLPINLRGMWIGTFHGLCNRFLRTHYRDAALPQTFQILDSADQIAAVKRLQKTYQIDDERYPARQTAWFINGCKEKGLRAKDVDGSSDSYTDFDGKLVEIYRLYDEQCQREGVVDFAELLLRSYELLTRNQPLREHYQARFRHILVDEFQDTNVLQYKWLKLLAGLGTADPASIFAVGDDDQSIYAFRGANVGNMAEFERDVLEKFGAVNVVKLEQNYRSHGHILDSANALIRNNSARLGKNLWTDAGLGEPVRVYEAMSDGQEAQWLVDEVRSLVRDGLSRADIAVLYRSNAQSRVIEHALFSAAIPYRVYGGLRFFERQEVKHALAYLRLVNNPDDDTSFIRVVNVPARGIGARTIEVLQDAAKAGGGEAGASSLYAAALKLDSRSGAAAAAKIGVFVKLIERLRFETQAMPLSEMIEHVNHASGLLAFYESEKEGAERIENLNELVNAAASFSGEEGFALNARANQIPTTIAPPRAELQTEGAIAVDSDDLEVIDAGVPDPAYASPLDAFLAHASLEAGDNQAGAGQDALQLMTVHSAKGLEFDAVFIGGLEEGLFPHDNSTTDLAGLEEERRLMYVAITRARKRLYLSFSQTRMLHGQTRYNPKSRFFEELPTQSLKWLTPKQGLQRAGGFGTSGNTYGRYSAAWEDTSSSEPVPAWAETRRGASADGMRRFRIGQSVVHAKFGEGVIVNLEGGGNDARAQINFGRQGMKWLALGIAKLEPA